MYPMLKPAIGKLTTEGGKLEGTAIQTTTTMAAVKSEDEVQQAKASADSGSKPTSIGGLGGMLAAPQDRKRGADDKDGGAKARATFMTTTNEVLRVATDVSADDVAIPAGFKEAK